MKRLRFWWFDILERLLLKIEGAIYYYEDTQDGLRDEIERLKDELSDLEKERDEIQGELDYIEWQKEKRYL